MRRSRLVSSALDLTLGLTSGLLALAITANARAAEDCKADSPALPVPQYSPKEAPGVSLWPLDPKSGEIRLRPAGAVEGVTRAELKPLPQERDSTQYLTQTAPGVVSGHELFQDVAVPGSRQEAVPASDWLIAVYNAGIQVWDISTPAKPNVVQRKDGWPPPYGPGEWAYFPVFGEVDTYVLSVDALRVDETIYIGVGARAGAGFSAWTFDTRAKILTLVYQDTAANARSVELVEAPGGGVYAFATAPTGVGVYDLSAAADKELCLDTKDDVHCGVYRGDVGDVPQAQFVATLVVDDRIYIAAADGSATTPLLGLEIWEVSDPDHPQTAVRRYSREDGRFHGLQLFSYAGHHYLALVDKSAGIQVPGEMRVHDVAHCFDDDGCADLGPAAATEPLKLSLANYHYLDVSFSEGAPFLHYGMETTGLFGSGFERLWELDKLPAISAPNTLPELTDGGGTYPDPCSGEAVDYFGDYYIKNDYGFRHFNPRHAIFSGAHLYRAATSVLDVHVRAVPICGDGVLQGREECDDGDDDDADECTNGCALPRCGDGILQAGEACDDGNDIADDSCTNACSLPTCGDGVVQAGEECDDPEDPSCIACVAGTSEGSTSTSTSSGHATSGGEDPTSMDASATSGAALAPDEGGCACAYRGSGEGRGVAMLMLCLLAWPMRRSPGAKS